MSDLMQTAQEIKEWWFMDYIPRWVAASSGKSGEGDGFITEYWNVPLYANALGTREWLNTADKVRKFLADQQVELQVQHYDHTTIPDRKVVAYNKNGGCIDVIWSRRRTDESEVMHLAVHFEVARMEDKGNGQRWRVIAIQSEDNSKSNALNQIFAQTFE